MNKDYYELSALPYSTDALEPFMDKTTVEIHHGRHHATYVGNLNAALEKASIDLASMDCNAIEKLLANVDSLPTEPANTPTLVRNNGGGHANHSLFWQILRHPDSGGGGQPSGELGKELRKKYGSYDHFKKEFTNVALKVFGSGWAWLVWGGKGLQLVSTPNQDSPLMQGLTPVMGLDVWEHAYYLKYQNQRPKYVESFWEIAYWPEIEQRYERAINGSLS